MLFLKDIGIVLRERVFKERDELVTLLTLEHGKRLFMSYGSRLPKSKKAAPLQLFNTVEFQARHSKAGPPVFEQVKLLTSRAFPMLEVGGLPSFYRASAMSAFVDRLLPEGAVAKEVFHALSFCLDHIGVNVSFALFQIRILSDLGYLPDFAHCSRCHLKLKLKDELCFSTDTKGFAHRECCRQKGETGLLLSVDKDLVRVMSFFQKGSMEKSIKVQVSEELQDEMQLLLEKIEVHS